MKGYSLHAVNDLRYEELEYPECATGWCVVKVKAAGICSSDIPRVYTKGTYHFRLYPDTNSLVWLTRLLIRKMKPL